VRPDKQHAQFAAVYTGSAVFGDAVQRKIKARLKPIGHSIRPFRYAIERFVRYQTTRERGVVQTIGCEVVVQREIEHSTLGNACVVYLNLVSLRQADYRHRKQRKSDEQDHTRIESVTNFHSASNLGGQMELTAVIPPRQGRKPVTGSVPIFAAKKFIPKRTTLSTHHWDALRFRIPGSEQFGCWELHRMSSRPDSPHSFG
jgi:hypothetical protein